MLSTLMVLFSIALGIFMLKQRCYSNGVYVVTMYIQACILAKTNNNWSSLGALFTLIALLKTEREE